MATLTIIASCPGGDGDPHFDHVKKLTRDAGPSYEFCPVCYVRKDKKHDWKEGWSVPTCQAVCTPEPSRINPTCL